jgi:transcriptional regulator with XRE-family HTH domain
MKSELDIYVANKVKTKRIEMKLSQEAFGDLNGLSQSYITHCESPKQHEKYNLKHIHAFAKFFKCSLYEFLPEYPLD